MKILKLKNQAERKEHNAERRDGEMTRKSAKLARERKHYESH